MSLTTAIRDFFDAFDLVAPRNTLLVAFSGGPDSTALLWGLGQVAPDLSVSLVARHVDHELDGDSKRRAQRAGEICRTLGVDFESLTLKVPQGPSTPSNREALTRQLRYRLLEEQRRQLGAAFVVTAHHADDQIETVLIRLLSGTGVGGLAGIKFRHDRVLRPVLGLRRHELSKAIAATDIEPVQDPSNLDLSSLRNRVRHLLLPHLLDRHPDLDEALLRLSRAARQSRSSLAERLNPLLDVRQSGSEVSLSRSALAGLPVPLWSFALALLHQKAGLAYPPSSVAQHELRRQLRESPRVGVDCGGGWRWQAWGDRLALARSSPPTPGFAYTVVVPGECEIPEVGLRFSIRRGTVDTWMFRPSSRRAGLNLPIRPGDRVMIRSRRAGDRIRPLGSPYTRRLKDVLIDRRVPRERRSRLPLLEVDSRLAWIPGVTVAEAFRVETEGQAWIAELESIEKR